LISDHHFGHSRIIEYCDRPFTSVGEMDQTMLDRHYETVDADDVLIHLGDVAMDMRDGTETVERFTKLNGDLLVRGNHDVGLAPADAPFPVVDACQLEQDGYTFYCVHRPEDVPESWDGWVIHGHHHNNDPETYPFVHYDARRVNVGVELVDYRPVALPNLTTMLDRCSPGDHIRDASTAVDRFEDSDS
jgi:calcineurin-like phosphoesterase family protein